MYRYHSTRAGDENVPAREKLPPKTLRFPTTPLPSLPVGRPHYGRCELTANGDAVNVLL